MKLTMLDPLTPWFIAKVALIVEELAKMRTDRANRLATCLAVVSLDEEVQLAAQKPELASLYHQQGRYLRAALKPYTPHLTFFEKEAPYGN